MQLSLDICLLKCNTMACNCFVIKMFCYTKSKHQETLTLVEYHGFHGWPPGCPQEDQRLTKDSLWRATRRPEPYRHAMKKTIDEVGDGRGGPECKAIA